jgi:hypothetical protein
VGDRAPLFLFVSYCPRWPRNVRGTELQYGIAYILQKYCKCKLDLNRTLNVNVLALNGTQETLKNKLEDMTRDKYYKTFWSIIYALVQV